MKFGSKKAIFGAILGGFQGFGPCLGFSHPTHPHLGEISQKKHFFFGSFPYKKCLIFLVAQEPHVPFVYQSDLGTVGVMERSNSSGKG